MGAWKARGSVPAILEVTADPVSCVVHEEECTQNLPFCGDVLRLMCAAGMAGVQWSGCLRSADCETIGISNNTGRSVAFYQ